MAEKKKRRERLSQRDHQRAIVMLQSAQALIGEVTLMYPNDLDLRVAEPAITRAIDATLTAKMNAAKDEVAPGD